jgi:hypothetical protein
MISSSLRLVARSASRNLSATNAQPVIRNPSFWQQMRSVFIQTTDTPNPESLKFVPSGIPVLLGDDINGYYVTKSDPAVEILRSPLAKQLLDVEGVKAVYLAADFITGKD